MFERHVLCAYQWSFLQRRFLAAFADVQGISYEVELISRGKIILDLRSNPVSAHGVMMFLQLAFVTFALLGSHEGQCFTLSGFSCKCFKPCTSAALGFPPSRFRSWNIYIAEP